MDKWVVCLNCDMRRHGSNSELIKELHEKKYADHKCEIRLQGEGEHIPFPCKNCGLYHSHYDAQHKN